MKSLSVIITILLLVLAGQLASHLKQAGALPSDHKSVSSAPVLHAQRPAHAGRAAPEFSNAAWKN
jgi:hypothetical protein